MRTEKRNEKKETNKLQMKNSTIEKKKKRNETKPYCINSTDQHFPASFKLISRTRSKKKKKIHRERKQTDGDCCFLKGF